MRKRLLGIIDAFSGRNMTVIGDLVADEFMYGQTARVSREAPVLVIRYEEMIRLPGGAANAANNLIELGCQVRVVGAIGADEPGRDIVAQLSEKGADTSNVVEVRSYHTPVKTRILAGAHHSAPQQIVRVDRVAELDATSSPPLPAPDAIVEGSDGIIMSDYGYGAVSFAILKLARRAAKTKAVPLVVDSRFRMSDFDSVTAITSNITELEAAVGLSIGGDTATLHRIARDVVRRQRLGCLLVTQGRYGMTLFERRARPVHIPIFGTDEVADVTGAGDTVISVFTLALACGAAPGDAARLANYAGGLVVMKRGTATVCCDELRSAVTKELS
jgi:rfaE bifunctional protein kinase chain/domain